MTDEPETESKPEDEGETLLEIGGAVVSASEDAATVPDAGETLLEIGQPSIYCDPDIQQTLLDVASDEASTLRDSQAETRRVAASPAMGGRRYELRGEIGRGGMGVVIRAFDRDLKRDVALKVTRADRSGSLSIARFVEEAQVTGQLSHPNIVPVHELAHEPGGRTFFTMKLVEGNSLARILRRLRAGDKDAPGEYPLTRRLYIFGQLLNCMAYAHDRGVIHRDLKPDNVMIGDYGEVMVMDWGLAKVRDKPELVSKITTTRLQTPGSETLDGTIIGTPAYMPPEQARGERDKIDERSDIYSLGAILYELLSLHPPYEATTASELIRRVATEPPPPPSVRNPEVVVPRGLESIVMKCLEPDAENRFQTVHELQKALEVYEEQVESSADEGLFFSLLGKTFAFLVIASTFLATAVVLVGIDNLYLKQHLYDPGVLSGLTVLGFGTMVVWMVLKPWAAFDATHGLLLWRRAGITQEDLRGYFVAEASRRAKWMYFAAADFTLVYSIAMGSVAAAIVSVQMFGSALLCTLAVGALEQGTYRKLDALDAISGQDRRDMLFRWMVVALVVALAVFFMNTAGWEWKLQRMPADFRRGTLMLHLVTVLAGVWVLAQIGHPTREVNRAMRALLTKRMTPELRKQVAPMARAFASNAVLFGAMGTLAWIGMISPGLLEPEHSVSATHYLMALTPLWSGILWSWFFRVRAGKILGAASDELVRRYREYRASPNAPKAGKTTYLIAWAPFILAGIAAAVVLILRAI
ncbi:MAG: serine/threonine protein kinase [Planctomycetes bacterium]|nr:serine/threonine protein kinase [Planctomycetota bacterium]